VTFARVVPVATYVDRHLRPWQLGASMFTVFGILALVIAAMGLYSMLAYTVTLRTHELGVRVALGARMSHVLRLVVGDGMRVTFVGVAIGLVAAALLAPLLQSLLYAGVSGRDPLIMIGVVVALLSVALLASLGPALRAARADPNVALRND
jgi:ABC-type antimicrobial peptide transport system permease subunit